MSTLRLRMVSVASPLLLRAPHAQTPGIRQVSDAADTVIPVQTRLRYTTMIVLPDEEDWPEDWFELAFALGAGEESAVPDEPVEAVAVLVVPVAAGAPPMAPPAAIRRKASLPRVIRSE